MDLNILFPHLKLKKWGIASLFFLATVFGSQTASADRFKGAFLDPPRAKHFHPRVVRGRSVTNQIKKSPTAATIQVMSPVRSQAARGTCSIFSATALAEGYVARHFRVDPRTIDLSEEWLQYLVNFNSSHDGSNAPTNLEAILRMGMSEEKALPYIGETWKEINQTPLSKQRCAGVPSGYQASCLIVHRDPRLMHATDGELMDRASPLYDPEFRQARMNAGGFRDRFLKSTRQITLSSTDEIRKSLLNGTPVILEVDFFYGAWNHRKAVGLGIQQDPAGFARGWVGYPEQGSLDRTVSQQGDNRSAHSILVVGYDDDYEIKVTGVRMRDGSTKDFVYKGAYIFKNSWGNDVFGSAFELGGARYPGYGAMTYAYAHQFGTFDALLPPR